MKPVYLEFNGINSFSEPARIDFKALLSGGVFGIFGNTGSGKSTILDSIHFALYGEIDRVPKSFNDCINHHSDMASVTFDFEITTDGVRKTYRVKRERKRKAGGTKAFLYEHTDSGLLALAEGTRDVDEQIERIIGLSFTDFKMCIALPQGDFAALVQSTTAERVKLVSRLFNLDKYGEKLTKAINEKYYQAETEVNLLLAKMGENEGGRDELIEQNREQLERERQTLAEAKTRAEAAKKEYDNALETDKKKREFDRLCVRLNDLQNRLQEMEELRLLLERFPKAQAVAEKAKAVEKAVNDERQANANAERAKVDYQAASTRLQSLQCAFEQQKYDEKIVQANVRLEKVRSAQQDIAAEKESKRKLDDCIAEYKKIENKYPKKDFENLRKRLERELETLGEADTFIDYIKRNLKDVLLTDAYGEFRTDLIALSKKHVSVQADIEVLLQKYALNAPMDGMQADIAAMHEAFKAQEKTRKALREQIIALEKDERDYAYNEQQKQLLVEQGKVYRANYNDAKAKIAEVETLGSLESLQKNLNALQMAKDKCLQAIQTTQNEQSKAYGEAEKQTGLARAYAKARVEYEQALTATLRTGAFESVEKAQATMAQVGDETQAQAKVKTFFDEYALATAEYKKIDVAAFNDFDENKLTQAELVKNQAQASVEALQKSVGALEETKARLISLKEKFKQQQNELKEKEQRKNAYDELRSLVRSNKFLEFIACEYLQEICLGASKTLLSLTNGRYFLQYDKEFKVGDNLDGGNLRAVKTLSGGETFLVSLSLALSLSAAICAKSRPIEFFFLDEGFGTLDEGLVDTVMDVLGKLSKSFAVGLISHVEELKHRIENKITVSGATETHGSTLRVDCIL